ncbi:MAG: DUF6477 family protein [Paracoccaceae bacterium]
MRAARFAATGQKPLRQSSRDLLAHAEALNTARLSGPAHYSPTRHIKTLSALIQLAQRKSTDASVAKENRPKLVAWGGERSPDLEAQIKASGISDLRFAI